MVRTFDDEVKALEDYGHDCCARIDDRIHECCKRIREAHEQELDNTRCAYEISMALMKKQPPLATYDALGNERHKAVCELRKLPDSYPNYSAFPFAKWYEDLSLALGIDKSEVSCAKVRDTLIHLLGGDQMPVTLGDLYRIWKGDGDGVDARPSDSASADSPVHGAAGCGCGGSCGCDGEELLAPITTELRGSMRIYGKFSIDDGKQHVELEADTFAHLCDAIDAVHAGLERDYATACRVNEQQDLEYIDLAKRYDKTITLPFDKDGKVWDVGDKLLDDGMVCEVVGIGPNRLYYYCDATDTVEWTQADSRRHYHAPTVEDVLREMLDAWGELPSNATNEAIIAEYADKLKLADA